MGMAAKPTKCENDGQIRGQIKQKFIGPLRDEFFFAEHLKHVGKRVKKAHGLKTKNRGTVGPDAVLHDSALLALNPGQKPGDVEHDEQGAGAKDKFDKKVDHDSAFNTIPLSEIFS